MKECCPGAPFVVFSSKPGVKIEFVNPIPSSGLFSLNLPIIDGDSVKDVTQRLSKSVKKIKGDFMKNLNILVYNIINLLLAYN